MQREPGERRTFATDRPLVIGVLIAGLGLGVLGYGLTAAGESPGPPNLVALAFAVFAIWVGFLAVKSGARQGLGVQEDQQLRIPCQFLTVTAEELLQTITTDPNFRPRTEQHSQLGS